jgi:hypothetical protein
MTLGLWKKINARYKELGGEWADNDGAVAGSFPKNRKLYNQVRAEFGQIEFYS